MGVNVSPNQLQDHEFVEHVRDALRTTGCPPSALVLEVTETVMADPRAVACLHELKRLGIGIALDDFGTGYSSLSYLQQLPIDVLKIDKSFIDGIDTHPDRAVLVNTVLRMGRALRLRTIAEGIEDADQLELLQRLGCQRGQGFYLSVPLRADAVEGFLVQNTSTSASPTRRPSDRDLVAVRIGPVPTSSATASLDFADKIIELLSGSSDQVIGVSPGVLALVRHYVDSWRARHRFGADVHVGRLRTGNRPAAARPRVDPHRRHRRSGAWTLQPRRSRAVPAGGHDVDPCRVGVDRGRVRRCRASSAHVERGPSRARAGSNAG